jgi:aspartyl-tRNA(Asn)/glutamyl-tRNA(Gln) amidotransferase subunit C
MEFTPDDLKRIARLARIAVADDEGANFANQLGGVFGLIEQLQAVDTRGVEPLAHPLDVIEHHAQRLRDDVAIEFDRREANMANAPARENGLFLVPKVLE